MTNRRESAPISGVGSLNAVCIVVYLALHAIWAQVVYGPYSFVELRVAFLIGIAVVLVWRRRSNEIAGYFIGRWLPQNSLREIIGMLAVVMMVRILREYTNPFPIMSGTQFIPNCVIAPINEEIVFRGVFVSVLLQYFPARTWLAVTVGTLVFVSVHALSKGSLGAHLNQLFSLLLLGGLLGWIFTRTRSVPFCILCHALWNLFAFLPVFHSK